MAKKVKEDNSIKYRLESGLDVLSNPGDDLYDTLVKMKEEGRPLIVPDDKFFKGLVIGERPHWNYKIGINNIKMRMKNLSMPSMPKSFANEYEFPDTIENISSEVLGNWMMKLASWKAYTIKLLAEADIERIIIDENFDSAVAKQLAVVDRAGKKVTKETVIGSLLSELEGFKDLKIKLIEKKAECETLKRVIEIYTTQSEAISREISRRGQMMQSIGKSI